MIRTRLYITLICCSLFTGTQACHHSRGPQGTSVTETGARAAVAAAPQIPATDSPQSVQPVANIATAQQPAPPGKPAADPDEEQFRSFFAVFQKAVQRNNPAQLAAMLYFPLQTAQQWTNQDLKDMHIDKEAGKVSKQEFNSYKGNIFNQDVLRLLPKAREEQLSEIDASSPEDYYKVLRKCTDKASKMYEVYMQYPETEGNAENYFAFVFGRVKGQYKVIGYYAKWPVKG